MVGDVPFKKDSTQRLYKRILENEVVFPDEVDPKKWNVRSPPPVVVSENAKDLIRKLLTKEPCVRLGSESCKEKIESHQFFKDVDWSLVESGAMHVNLNQDPTSSSKKEKVLPPAEEKKDIKTLSFVSSSAHNTTPTRRLRGFSFNHTQENQIEHDTNSDPHSETERTFVSASNPSKISVIHKVRSDSVLSTLCERMQI